MINKECVFYIINLYWLDIAFSELDPLLSVPERTVESLNRENWRLIFFDTIPWCIRSLWGAPCTFRVFQVGKQSSLGLYWNKSGTKVKGALHGVSMYYKIGQKNPHWVITNKCAGFVSSLL